MYDDGTLAAFDTGALTAGQPFGGSDVVTEMMIDFGRIADEGICVELRHNDAVAGQAGETPYADRVRGCRVCLAEPEDLPRILSVLVDGRLAAWRQAGTLVDGVQFERACRLWYSDAPYAGDNYKACRLYEYLEAARPDLRGDPAAICALFGYPGRGDGGGPPGRGPPARRQWAGVWRMRALKAALAAAATFLAWLFRAVFRWFM